VLRRYCCPEKPRIGHRSAFSGDPGSSSSRIKPKCSTTTDLSRQRVGMVMGVGGSVSRDLMPWFGQEFERAPFDLTGVGVGADHDRQTPKGCGGGPPSAVIATLSAKSS
jgi:hypothetical protein